MTIKLGPYEGHTTGPNGRVCRFCHVIFDRFDQDGLREHVAAKHIPKPRRKTKSGVQGKLPEAEGEPAAPTKPWRRRRRSGRGVPTGRPSDWVCTTCGAIFGSREDRRLHDGVHAGPPKRVKADK